METIKLAADLYFPALSSLQYHQKAFVQWLPGQEFLPTDAFDEIFFVEQELIYLPFYGVTGHFEATFSCQIGEDRQETYCETEYDSETNEPREVTHTRTVTDWSPYSGSTARKSYTVHACAFNLTGPLLRGIRHDSKELFNFLEKIGASGSPSQLDAEAASQLSLPQFELNEDQAYRKRAKPQLDALILEAVKSKARQQGDHYDNLSWNAEITHEFSPYYAPIWLTRYTYRSQTHHFLSSGRQSSINLGTAPFCDEDRAKARSYYLPFKLSLIPAIVFLILLITSFDKYFFPAVGIFILSAILAIIGRARNRAFINKQQAQLSKAQANVLQNLDTFFAQ